MTPFLQGFAEELIKLGVADAAAAGTGIKPPAPMKPIKAIKPVEFKPPPGLPSPKPPRMPKATMQMPRATGTPKAWSRPGVNS